MTSLLGVRHPDRVALHTNSPQAQEPADLSDDALPPEDARWLAETREFWRRATGYAIAQATRPQTLGYALVDSPIGQLAWIAEKMHDWRDRGEGSEDETRVAFAPLGIELARFG